MISHIVTQENIEAVSSLLAGCNKVAITCHVSPDGDAIGSTLGWYHFVRSLGKQATVVVPDMPPRTLYFLPGARDIVIYTQTPEKATQALLDADLLFAMDFNTIDRIDKLGNAFLQSRARKVMIDHHIGPGDFCDVVVSHHTMSSTCELVFRILYQMGQLPQMSRRQAECIYTGMMTDTGNFTYNSNDPELYLIVAELVRKGINKDRIYTYACNTQTANKLMLNSYAICHKMELFPQYKAAMIWLSRAEMEQYKYQKGDCEGLVNVPLSIKDVVFSAFIREDRNYIKISLRSQGKFPVNIIAQEHFNGGGHYNAAGGEFYGSLEEAVALFKKVLPIYCGAPQDGNK